MVVGGRGGEAVGNDVEIRKSSRVTMQAFCECGFGGRGGVCVAKTVKMMLVLITQAARG